MNTDRPEEQEPSGNRAPEPGARRPGALREDEGPEPGKKQVFICGDSTAASYDPEKTLMVGWGQLLQGFLPEARVCNHAIAGRSTKSFLAEGRLQALDGLLRPGDLLLIQFAHNDEDPRPERHTEPRAGYTENLGIFLDFARARGAVPVLLTPICMRIWENGVLQPTHGEYLQAMTDLAEARQVPLIDMYAESFRLTSARGEEGSKAFFMHLAPGEHPEHPGGRSDNAHTRRAGAEAFASYAARCLRPLLAEAGSGTGK